MSKYLLQQYLKEAAVQYPKNTAVKLRDEKITYTELWEQSTKLAQLLAASGVQRGDLVAVYMEKSIEAVIGIYGVLIAGAAYIPLDMRYSPLKRAAGIVERSGAKCVITSSRPAMERELTPEENRLPDTVTEITVLPFSHGCQFEVCKKGTVWPGENGDSPPDGGTDADLAYVLYTSGSTGTPKGVMLSHRNALTFVDWAVSYFHPCPDWNFSSFASFQFDLSVFDIYVCAACGGCLNLVPAEISGNPGRIISWIRENTITCMYTVPSLWTAIFRYAHVVPEDLQSLKEILFAGEVFIPKDLKRLMAAAPGAGFCNLYGPTETNVCTCHRVETVEEIGDKPVPIGRACANTEVFILDESGEEITGEGEGELYVKGSIVMQGYFNEPALTSAVLSPSRLLRHHGARIFKTGDLVRRHRGLIEFVGRKDHMVKRNGFRIEPAEIEYALLSDEDVREAAVVSFFDKGREAACVYAAVSMNDGGRFSVIRMQNRLAALLPRFMLPDTIVQLDEIPKNANGKTDRVAARKLIEEMYQK